MIRHALPALVKLLLGLLMLAALRPAPAAEPNLSQIFTKNQAVISGDEKLSQQLAEKLFDGKSLLTTTGVEPSPVAAIRPPLTAETMATMLDNLGLPVTPGPRQPGMPVGFALNYKRGTWTVPMAVILLADGRNIAMGAVLAYKVDSAKVTAAQWEELLAANDTMAPCYFTYSSPQKQLNLFHIERNVDISPATMRAWIEQVADLTIATHPKWKPFTDSAPTAK